MGQVVASLVLIGCDESVKGLSIVTGQPLSDEFENILVTCCVIVVRLITDYSMAWLCCPALSAVVKV